MTEICPIAETGDEDRAQPGSDAADLRETAMPAGVCKTSFARLAGNAAGNSGVPPARADGKPEARVHYRPHRYMRKTANVCHLQDSPAAPVHRGRGAGRHSIAAVHAAAGGPGAILSALAGMAPARRLCARAGRHSPFPKHIRA